MEDLIFRYLDGECTVEEIREVDFLRKSDPDFAAAFRELQEANEMLLTVGLDEVPKGFTNKVMKQILPQVKIWTQGSFVSKVLVAVIFLCTLLIGIDALPIAEKYSISLEEIINPRILTYGILLAFFFLAIDWFLNKKEAKHVGQLK